MIPGDFQYTKPTKQQLLKFGALGIFGLATLAVVALVLTFVISSWLGQPVVFGFNDGPTQPIAFPHTVHTGTDVHPGNVGDGDGERDAVSGDAQSLHRLLAVVAGPAIEFRHGRRGTGVGPVFEKTTKETHILKNAVCEKWTVAEYRSQQCRAIGFAGNGSGERRFAVSRRHGAPSLDAVGHALVIARFRQVDDI